MARDKSRERMAATLQRLADELADLTAQLAKREGLPVPRSLTRRGRTLHNRSQMSQTATAIGTLQPRRGRPSESKHPFVQALAAKGSSLAVWAKAHDLERGRVKGWIAAGDGARRIPRQWAEVIEAEFLDPKTKKSTLPATLATWPQGIH